MIEVIWNDYLFQPMFNVLIWMYNNWSEQNLGWAVVYLTLMLRCILLPLTILGEKNRIKNLEVVDDVRRIDKEFRNDPILKKEEMRNVMKKRKMRPWTKVVTLGIQLIVLVLLYQVFLRGITGEKLIKFLYDWVDFPGSIDVMFYGFNLGQNHDIVWPGIVGLFLLTEIYLNYNKVKKSLSKADLFYFILFPVASFLILWWLPMVKSLFILTSLVFSAIVRQFMKIIFKPAKAGKKA